MTSPRPTPDAYDQTREKIEYLKLWGAPLGVTCVNLMVDRKVKLCPNCADISAAEYR